MLVCMLVSNNICQWSISVSDRRVLYPSSNVFVNYLVSMAAIHSTIDRTGQTGKRGQPQKVVPFFRNFSGWTEPSHYVLDRNFRKFWLNGSRPIITFVGFKSLTSLLKVSHMKGLSKLQMYLTDPNLNYSPIENISQAE